MDADFIDKIYECAFVPDLWPRVFGEIAADTESFGAALLITSPRGLRWTGTPNLREGIEIIAKTGLVTRGQRWDRLRNARSSGFVREVDVYTEAEMAADPFYAEFSWPRGFGHAAGTMIILPTDETLVFNVERKKARGPVEPKFILQLDALRPHLARAALMSARLLLERARAASDALALVGLPTIVLDARGKAIAANRLAEELQQHVIWRARDRVSFVDKLANHRLEEALAAAEHSSTASSRSFALKDDVGAAALVAHLIPVRGDARDIFGQSSCVLVLTPIAAPSAPPVELIKSLFDLTPSEAHVARSLAAGGSIDDIATKGSVSRNTVRSHVRGVLEKTGCRRQAEVVALLGGIMIPAAV